MRKPEVIILGGGPAGLAAAFRSASKDKGAVTVLEKETRLGGLASSLEIFDIPVDFGSHRLHPACPESILQDVHRLLGKNLVLMPRHGRIRLRNRWIRFPLKIPDLLVKLPPDFSIGFARDLALRLFPKNTPSDAEDSFAHVLTESLGPTICGNFYFPYAKKIWGLDPCELSSMQARKRVAAGSIKKLLSKLVGPLSPEKRKLQNGFFYPAQGFGSLCDGFARKAREGGVEFITEAQVTSICLNGPKIESVSYKIGEREIIKTPDYLFSTIPIPLLLSLITPPPAKGVIDASANLTYRSMIFVYLVLGCSQFTEFDAHYFPEGNNKITRLSEPKNYRRSDSPRSRTVLCAELPCVENDPEWLMTDRELGDLVLNCLKQSDLEVRVPVEHVETRRKIYGYPIYRRGYEFHLGRIEEWLMELENLVMLGRQGLFMHDNVHHAFAMGYAAAECIEQNGIFNHKKWKAHRKIFDSFVVVD